MSGIAGLLRFDGQTVTRRGLERAASALAQYGPDRADVYACATVGLVHVLMRMTPEDRFDRQPQQGASGSLITADVRLDNRDDVLTRIGIGLQEAAAWSDSRVLLAGWEKLGDDVWPMLRGPFAVAIWDPRSRALTLARDHLGLNVGTKQSDISLSPPCQMAYSRWTTCHVN
jgi:asparagine synthase (glutamine-hydrolysing)